MTLRDLLERVEGAPAGDQDKIIRGLARELFSDDAGCRRRINLLCSAGGYESAALALIGRVLPGWSWGVSGGLKATSDALLYEPWPGGYRAKIRGEGSTPALALCAALLAAMIEQEGSSRSHPCADIPRAADDHIANRPDADTSSPSNVGPGRPTDSNLQNLQSAPNQPTPKEPE